MWHLKPLILKELQILIQNRTTLRLLLLPVVLQTLLFPFAATLELKRADILIWDQSQNDASQELIQRITQVDIFRHWRYVYDEVELTKRLDEQEALVGLIIPPHYTLSNATSPSSLVQLLVDGRKINSGQIATHYIQNILMQILTEKGIPSSPINIAIQHFYNPNLETKWFILPSLVAIITTIGCLTVTALSLVREREEGTYDQLRVSPLNTLSMMLGKTIPAIIVAMIQASIITLIALTIFQLPFTGSWFAHYFAMMIYTLSLAGFGLLISALCHTQQQAFLGTFFFMVPAVILSGFLAPVENMTSVFYGIAQINPLMHYMKIVRGIFLQGYGFMETLTLLWPLLFIALVTSSTAYILLSRE